MKPKYFILSLHLFLLYPLNGYSQKPNKWIPDMVMINPVGFPSIQLYRNSPVQYVAEPRFKGLTTGGIIGWNTDKEHRKGIGFTYTGFQHEVDQKTLETAILRGGPNEYGQMWFHDWSEMAIGIVLWKTWPRNPYSMFKGVISSGMSWSSRGNIGVYVYEQDKFLYPAWKPGFGKYMNMGMFYEFTPFRESREIRVNLGLEYILGNVMADYEICYGVGQDYMQYESIHFFKNYIISRLQFSIGITIDVWNAKFGPSEKPGG